MQYKAETLLDILDDRKDRLKRRKTELQKKTDEIMVDVNREEGLLTTQQLKFEIMTRDIEKEKQKQAKDKVAADKKAALEANLAEQRQREAEERGSNSKPAKGKKGKGKKGKKKK